MLETDGGAVEPEQVDDVIVGVGETFVIKLPVTWENDLLLRTELLVECKGSGIQRLSLRPGIKCEKFCWSWCGPWIPAKDINVIEPMFHSLIQNLGIVDSD